MSKHQMPETYSMFENKGYVLSNQCLTPLFPVIKSWLRPILRAFPQTCSWPGWDFFKPARSASQVWREARRGGAGLSQDLTISKWWFWHSLEVILYLGCPSMRCDLLKHHSRTWPANQNVFVWRSSRMTFNQNYSIRWLQNEGATIRFEISNPGSKPLF